MEDITVYKNDIESCLDQFCIDNKIDDIKKESQSIWNAFLLDTKSILFNDKECFKDKTIKNNGSCMESNCNRYNYELINNICDIYISLCFRYNKEVSVRGFYHLTGISEDSIIRWGLSNNREYLSTKACEIYQKLHSEREESLSNIVMGSAKPVGTLAILNKFYGWNMPGVRDTKKADTLTAENLPLLSQNHTQLETTNQENLIEIVDTIQDNSAKP